MNLDLFKSALSKGGIEFCENEPMKNHTSFKVGGNADVFIKVKSEDELLKALAFCEEYNVPFFILGKGSNLLVSDLGIEGAVISLLPMDKITVLGDEIICEAGVGLSSLCRAVAENSLSGLEFAYGIPGSVGGAIFMNAGAYGGEIKDVIVSARYIENGEIKEISAENMQLAYRTSCFKNMGAVILSATFRLKKGEKSEIKAAMDDYMNRRLSKQPLEYSSAGSTFKRPEGYFAGALIEECGLKGCSCGDACVSEKHAGFVINKGNASCKEICSLINNIQDAVQTQKGVSLETEVIFVGRKN